MSGPLSFVIQKARIEELEKQVLGRNEEIAAFKVQAENDSGVIWECHRWMAEQNAEIARLKKYVNALEVQVSPEMVDHYQSLQTQLSAALELLKRDVHALENHNGNYKLTKSEGAVINVVTKDLKAFLKGEQS